MADFCPVCRAIQPVKLLRVGMVSHFYYIPLGSGSLVGFYTECNTCKVHMVVEPERYAGFCKKKRTDLESLIQQTFPNIHAAYSERLEAEAQLANIAPSMTQEQRRGWILEPFKLLNSTVEEHYSDSMKFDIHSCLAFLITFLVGFFLFSKAMALSGKSQSFVLKLDGVLFGIGIVYSLIQLYLAQGRLVRKQILPALTRALTPLQPDSSELQNCLDHCKVAGMKIGRAITAKQVSQQLAKAWFGTRRGS